MKTTKRARFHAVVGCFRKWKESKLISQDGQMVYIVRDREGEERQVLHRLRGWEPVSAARFSTLPCFEDYHREKFETAIPYKPNTSIDQREASDPTGGSDK